MSTLLVEGIEKSYPTRSGALEVLRKVNLRVGAGESAVIMGPSGSGKSTLLNIIGTLEQPTAGRLTIEATDPFALESSALARFRNRRIGFVFQEHHLLMQCSVIENVLLPTLATRSQSTTEEVDRARDLIDRMGLADRIEHLPSELSGGERQRVAIARALIHQPSLLLTDEPTGNLDQETAGHVGDLIDRLYRDARCALVVVTHSESFADRFDRRYTLDGGELR